MGKPTEKEVKTEIEVLRKLKPTVKQFSSFGDDHHKAIEVQIKVLEKGLDGDAILDRWEDDSNALIAAEDAQQWRDGIRRDSEEEGPPHEAWDSLIQK